MNRLVIVGNGFDLAHGLPTGYCDFIDSYWNKIISSLKININDQISINDGIVEINFSFYRRSYIQERQHLIDEISRINSFDTLASFVSKHRKIEHNISFSGDFRNFNPEDSCEIKYLNQFFEIINSKRSIQNWVDIENEYYGLLKNCLDEEDNVKVRILNKEFEQIKSLLEEYLHQQIDVKYDFNKPNNYYEQILDIFKIRFRYLSDSGENDPYLKEFPKSDHDELITFDNRLIEIQKVDRLNDYLNERLIVQDTLFLNFNYTKTISFYNSILEGEENFGKSREIQIHGKLRNIDNLINFGFGDEMDDHYKLIENKVDNEYLRNIKSFQYFQNSNYKDMLDFIESDKFQVYIMGHSCGLSDRILLNKIFENNNCRSIKVFYHQFDEPKADGRTDNYTEIVQNISRHFNKKEMMREKIVNKSLCQPLPQNIRFAKKENGSQL